MAKRRNLLLASVLAIVCLASLLTASLVLGGGTSAQAETTYEYVLNTERKATSVSDTPAVLTYAYNGSNYALTAKSDSELGVTPITITDNKITSSVTSSMLWTVEGKRVRNSNGQYLSLNPLGLNATGEDIYNNDSSIYTDSWYVNCNASSVGRDNGYGSYTSFTVYEQQEVQSSGGSNPSISLTQYKKIAYASVMNNVMVIANVNGKHYALATFSATSTSGGYAKEVELTGDVVNKESVEDYKIWSLSSGAIKHKVAQKYLPAPASYTGWSLSSSGVYYTITATASNTGYTLKQGSNYMKLNSNGNAFVSTTNLSEAAVFNFYQETTVEITNPATIKFNKNVDAATGTMDDVVVSQDTTSAYTLPQCGFTYANYKFAGWQVNGEIKQPGDEITLADCVDENNEISVSAQWEYNCWDIVFKMDGQDNKTIPVVKGTSYTFVDNTDSKLWGSSSNPTNQLFSHWTDGTNTYKKGDKITPETNLEFTAVFADAVTITYYLNDGTDTVSSTKLALPGERISLLSSRTRPDYIFQGWKADGDDTLYSASSYYTVGDSDVAMRAQWKFNGFTITFMVGDEVYAVKEHVKVTDQYSNYNYKFAENGIEEPAAPDGKVFGKWTTTSKYNNSSSYSLSCSSSSYADWYLTLPRESTYGGINNYDVVLVAQFVDPPIDCTFIFQTEDGTLIKTENKTIPSTGNPYCSVYTNDTHKGTPPDGYMFLNWTDDDGKVWTPGNIFIYRTDAKYKKTLTAHYAKAVNLSFNFNNGNAPSSGSWFTDKQVAQGSKFTLYTWANQGSSYTMNNLPTKEGFLFMGWQVGEGADAVRYLVDLHYVDHPNNNQSIDLTMENDTTFVAIWGKEQYTVSFVVNGSTTTKTVKNGDSFDMSLYGNGTPFQAGKIFVGWKDADEQLVDADEAITPTEDMTFTASFRDPETYTVTFHFNGTTKTKGFVENSRSETSDQTVFNELFADMLDGRRISCQGWYSDEALTEGNRVQLNVANVPASFKDLHLYAKTSEEFIITFDYGVKADPDDEANKTSQNYGVLGATVAVPYPAEDSGVPDRENYTLVGWATSPDSQEIAYKAERGVNLTIAGSVTLYAVWDYNFYTITLKLNDADNTEIKAEVSKKNSSFTLKSLIDGLSNEDKAKINVPHKTVNWVDADSEDHRAVALTDVIANNADRTFQGSFADVLYTITLTNTGAEDIVLKGVFGSAVTAPQVTRAGYEFVSWNLNGTPYEFTTMPEENITLYGVWTALDSTLTFDTGDGGSVIAPVTQKSGSAVDKPADPTRTDYTFAGWTLNGQEVRWTKYDLSDNYYLPMPGGGGTLVAKWNITAEGLEKLKTAKLAELAAYAEEQGVDVPSNGIETATSEEGVLSALQTAKAAVDTAKAALTAKKTAAKEELAAYAQSKGVAVPSNTIDSAKSVEAVETALATAKSAVDKLAESKAKVDAAKQAVAGLAGKTGEELFAQLKVVDTAVAALNAEEKAQVDLTMYNTAKAAIDALANDAQADLEVAAQAGAAIAVAKLGAAVTALALGAALAFVLKRRMF